MIGTVNLILCISHHISEPRPVKIIILSNVVDVFYLLRYTAVSIAVTTTMEMFLSEQQYSKVPLKERLKNWKIPCTLDNPVSGETPCTCHKKVLLLGFLGLYHPKTYTGQQY